MRGEKEGRGERKSKNFLFDALLGFLQLEYVSLGILQNKVSFLRNFNRVSVIKQLRHKIELLKAIIKINEYKIYN